MEVLQYRGMKQRIKETAPCDRLAVLSAMIVLLQIIRAAALKTDCPIHPRGSSAEAPGEAARGPGQRDAGPGASAGNQTSVPLAPAPSARHHGQIVVFHYHIIIFSRLISKYKE